MANRRYHRIVFELLGAEPLVSPASRKQIGAWEREHGVKLPSAVRQWYEREPPDKEVTAGFFHPSDGAYHPIVYTCRLVSLAELLRGYAMSGTKVLFAAGEYDPRFCYRDSEWKLFLVKDTGSDPLVINQDDDPELTLGRGLDNPGRFSDFLLDIYWDNTRPGGVKLFIEGGTINPACLDYSKEHYREAWGWIGEAGFCYAFFDQSVRIHVGGWKGGNPMKEELPVAWRFEASSEEALHGVLHGLWPLASIPLKRSPEVIIHEHPKGLLRRLARRFPDTGGT